MLSKASSKQQLAFHHRTAITELPRSVLGWHVQLVTGSIKVTTALAILSSIILVVFKEVDQSDGGSFIVLNRSYEITQVRQLVAIERVPLLFVLTRSYEITQVRSWPSNAYPNCLCSPGATRSRRCGNS